ncbi:MAG: ABC transporter permease [Otoolea sp.]|nr:ABC transporter permease [Clostridiaceae bacterium]MDY5483393.1 ABC transporter permease [Clostridium sp.]
MTKYILKRIGISIVTIFVLVSVVFFLARLMPGGPFNDPKMSATAKANLSAYYGFDKPVMQQYLTYLNNLIHGNFGFSTKYPSRTVNDLLAGAFPFSADLGIRALCFAISFGLVFGIISALNRGNKIDLFFVIVAVIGTSVPDFIMGAILQYFFAIKWGLFPIAQYKGFSYTILPAVGLGFYTMASVSRIMRASMLEVVQQDYIKTARSKGISKFRVTWKHQIRNAIMPVITILGPTVAAVLTGTFVIESLFAIPGMGKYYVESVQNNDYSLILGMTAFYGTFLVFCNMIVDILYGIVDPRVRIGGK